MPELHICRAHRLGLPAARVAAQRWAAEAEQTWGMHCHAEPGGSEDKIHFERSGVSGCLKVNAQQFDLQVSLGFLLGPLAGRIEQHIRQSLDELLGTP